jgi:hypothetical protein
MGQASWRATADGRYWVDVELGNLNLRLMIDLGLLDPLDQVAFEVEPAIYDLLKRSGQLAQSHIRNWRNASGRSTKTEVGLIESRLIDPVNGQPVGPVVLKYVNRGTLGVPSRVGVVFFHSLSGCKVIWDLDNRMWSVEYP